MPAVASVTLRHRRSRPTADAAGWQVERAEVVPAAGRERIAFITQSERATRVAKKSTVTPADALPLVAAGLLDPALFNVTGLVRQGLALAKTACGAATDPHLRNHRARRGARCSPPWA